MPPKKTLKAIAAEIKKKNTAEAEGIIANLTRKMTKSSPDPSDKPKKSSKEKNEKVAVAQSKKNDTEKAKASKPESLTQRARKDQDIIPTTKDNAVPMETNFDPSLAFDVRLSAIDHSRAIGRAKSTWETSKSSRDSTDKPRKSSKEKTEKDIAAESKKKDAGKSKEIVSKPETSSQAGKDQDMIPTTNDNLVPMETDFDPSFANVDSAVDHSRAIGRVKSVSKSQRTKPVSSSASSSKASKASVSARKPRTPKIGDYQYEIDCQKVADAIDVKDLKRYLEEQLKVNGKKKNLDGTISIHCKGNIAVIKSNTFIPKKSLRFLSKKFLKRNWNIRVVSKNVHSYEYKYVGSL